MSFLPLNFEVVKVERVVTQERDELGNSVSSESVVETPVKVAGWAVPRADEPKLAGHDRRTVEVELFAPVGVFQLTDGVILPGRSDVLEVIGEPENYEHNPFGWSPGLEVINLAGVI